MADTANRVALYASVGPELTHYDLDVEGATSRGAARISPLTNVHYATARVAALSLCRIERQRRGSAAWSATSTT